MSAARKKLYNVFQWAADKLADDVTEGDVVFPTKKHAKTPFEALELPLSFPSIPGEETMTESEICIICHGCCNYVTIALDFPKTKQALDEYRWYLLHRNVEIFIDNDDDWQLLFKTPCDYLGTDGYCKTYETRPNICRDYSGENCSRTGKDHQFLFSSPEQMDGFLEAKKKKSKKKTRATRK